MRSVKGSLKLAIATVPTYPGREFLIENDGLRYRCDLTSYLEWNLAALRGYEEDEKNAFLALFPPERRALALDIGANVGAHSVRFAQIFRRVVAFDPNPITFKRLQTNLALNPQLNVEPHNIGLGEESGKLAFYQPKVDFWNQGTGTFDPDFAPDEYNLIELPVIRGDDFLAENGIGRVDAIKMDVQGFEPQVICGLRATIARDRPLIWLEISGATIAEIESRGGLGALLPDSYHLRKFETWQKFGVLHRLKVTRLPMFVPDGEGNYLLIPDEWK
jgi:FkbM family methyltransferase